MHSLYNTGLHDEIKCAGLFMPHTKNKYFSEVFQFRIQHLKNRAVIYGIFTHRIPCREVDDNFGMIPLIKCNSLIRRAAAEAGGHNSL